MSIFKKLQSSSKKDKIAKAGTVLMTMALCSTMAFAGDAATEIQGIMTEMVKIVGMIFQAVGVMLSVYSVGQLVLAFKNEDADSKSRASTMLVVGICLIVIPSVINSLDLVSRITG